MALPRPAIPIIVIVAILLAACAPAAQPNPTTAPAKPAATTAAAKPAAKPTEKPAAKPAEKAAEKPATKATEKPAAKAESKAEAKPAAKAPAKPEDIQVPKPSGNLTFKIAYASQMQFVHLPTVLTTERLNKEGWQIENVFFAQSELATEAVAKRETQFGAGASVSALRATQAGTPLPLVMEYYRNALVLAAKRDIKSCEDLNGRKLAIHSEGAVATAQLRSWLGQTCNAKPDYLIIPGSPNRATAMMAGQVDATPMFLSDWVRLRLQKPEEFHFIVNFADALPTVKANVHFADAAWLEQNAKVATAFAAEMLKTHRIVAANPRLLEDYTREKLPELEQQLIPEIVRDNLEQGVFALNGGLTLKDVQGTIEFFTGTGELKEGVPLDKAANLSILQDALKIVGEVPGKP